MLLIFIQKRGDGVGVLRCERADGSVTWQKQTDRHAAFFALHDLTHFAVETTLGFRRGFFGLVAEGWAIEDTSGKGAKGPLPEEAGMVELLVGLLDAERAGGILWTVEEFNDFASRKAEAGQAVRTLTAEELAAVRACRADLFRRWFAVPSGGVLELKFSL